MRIRGFDVLYLILAASILALTPIADANPPDPSWIRGIFDDADLDDVVNSVTSTSSIPSALAVADFGPAVVKAAPAPPRVQEVVPFVPLSAHHLRSPPAR